MRLTDDEKRNIIELIKAGKPLPAVWKSKLFDSGDEEFVEATKVYQLTYKGKTPKQDVLANTLPAPFQEVPQYQRGQSIPR